MTLRVEIDPTINRSELKLSKAEAEHKAYSLMEAFRSRLFSLEQFKNAAADVYLNITGDQNKNVDKPRREVNFALGDSKYRVDYSFSGNEQNLIIVKDEFGSPEDPSEGDQASKMSTDVIILKSKKFWGQKPIPSPEVRWHHPVGSLTYDLGMNIPSPQTNTAYAVEKAYEMLAGLSPQK